MGAHINRGNISAVQRGEIGYRVVNTVGNQIRFSQRSFFGHEKQYEYIQVSGAMPT
jgi:hypothetical protein